MTNANWNGKLCKSEFETIVVTVHYDLCNMTHVIIGQRPLNSYFIYPYYADNVH